LRDRYARLAVGASRPDEVWLNWIARRRSDSQAIGTVQATLTIREGRRSAQVAWVIGVEWQNQGFASEAARALVEWLLDREVDEVTAHIHPDHRASAAVAARAGLKPTDDEVDGEHVWRTPERNDRPCTESPQTKAGSGGGGLTTTRKSRWSPEAKGRAPAVLAAFLVAGGSGVSDGDQFATTSTRAIDYVSGDLSSSSEARQLGSPTQPRPRRGARDHHASCFRYRELAGS
jgi:hypothetical protein